MDIIQIVCGSWEWVLCVWIKTFSNLAHLFFHESAYFQANAKTSEIGTFMNVMTRTSPKCQYAGVTIVWDNPQEGDFVFRISLCLVFVSSISSQPAIFASKQLGVLVYSWSKYGNFSWFDSEIWVWSIFWWHLPPKLYIRQQK
jgi:hypothetical protein